MVIPNNFTLVSVLIILLAILTSKPLLLLLSFVKIIEWNFSGFTMRTVLLIFDLPYPLQNTVIYQGGYI